MGAFDELMYICVHAPTMRSSDCHVRKNLELSTVIEVVLSKARFIPMGMGCTETLGANKVMSSINDNNPSAAYGNGFKRLNDARELESRGDSLCDRELWGLALPVFKDALEKRKQEVGCDDISTATLLVKIGDALLHQDKPTEAGENFAQAATMLERNYYPSHARLAPVLEKQADALMVEEKYAEAEPILKRSADIYVNTLTMENRATLRSYYKLAKLYLQLDRPDDAKKVIEKAMRYVDTPLGPVAEFRYQMALAQVMSKNDNDAKDLLKDASDGFRQRSNYLRVVECLEKYAAICRETGEYAQAEVALKEAGRYKKIEHFYPEDIFVATLLRA